MAHSHGRRSVSPGVDGITKDEPAITAPAPIETIPSRMRWLLLRPESPAKLASSRRIRARVSDTRRGSGNSGAVRTVALGVLVVLVVLEPAADVPALGAFAAAVVLALVAPVVAPVAPAEFAGETFAGCGVGVPAGAGCGAVEGAAASLAAVFDGGLAASLDALIAPASLEFVGVVGAYVVPSGRRGASHGEGATFGVCAPANAVHHETTNPIHRANSRFTNSTVARAMPRGGRRYSLGQLVQFSCRCLAARSQETRARAQRGSVGGAPSRSPVSEQSSRDAWQIASVARHTSRQTPADACS